MGLSADTTEESTAEGMQKFPLNQCCGTRLPVGACRRSKDSPSDTWVAIINTNT